MVSWPTKSLKTSLNYTILTSWINTTLSLLSPNSPVKAIDYWLTITSSKTRLENFYKHNLQAISRQRSFKYQLTLQLAIKILKKGLTLFLKLFMVIQVTKMIDQRYTRAKRWENMTIIRLCIRTNWGIKIWAFNLIIGVLKVWRVSLKRAEAVQSLRHSR